MQNWHFSSLSLLQAKQGFCFSKCSPKTVHLLFVCQFSKFLAVYSVQTCVPFCIQLNDSKHSPIPPWLFWSPCHHSSALCPEWTGRGRKGGHRSAEGRPRPPRGGFQTTTISSDSPCLPPHPHFSGRLLQWCCLGTVPSCTIISHVDSTSSLLGLWSYRDLQHSF